MRNRETGRAGTLKGVAAPRLQDWKAKRQKCTKSQPRRRARERPLYSSLPPFSPSREEEAIGESPVGSDKNVVRLTVCALRGRWLACRCHESAAGCARL